MRRTAQGDPPAEYARYHDLALYYMSSGQLWLAASDDWLLNEQGQPVDYHVSTIREFRYQGGQRYFTRLWQPGAGDPHDITQWTPDPSAMWTEYLGGQPYTDFEAHLDEYGQPVATEQARFLAGDGIHAQQTLDGQSDPIRYLHGDLIDSTMMLTDEVGSPAETTAYTAFGELVTPNSALSTRYAYAGGWGYESGLLALTGATLDLPPITLQQVGGAWYDAALGRFVQRDPLGIWGAPNVYAYCDSEPQTMTYRGFWWDFLKAMLPRLVNVVREWSIPKTTTPRVGPGLTLNHFFTCVQALEAIPDIVRLWIAKKQRDRLIDDPNSDINKGMDEYEHQHGRWVKPRRTL